MVSSIMVVVVIIVFSGARPASLLSVSVSLSIEMEIMLRPLHLLLLSWRVRIVILPLRCRGEQFVEFVSGHEIKIRAHTLVTGVNIQMKFKFNLV